MISVCVKFTRVYRQGKVQIKIRSSLLRSKRRFRDSCIVTDALTILSSDRYDYHLIMFMLLLTFTLTLLESLHIPTYSIFNIVYLYCYSYSLLPYGAGP